jgi:hypothetical protein
MKNSLISLVVCAAASAAAAAPAPDQAGLPYRFRLTTSALYYPQTLDFDGTQSISLYAETGQVATRYGAKSAVAVDGGLQFNFSRGVGIVAAFETASRGSSANVDAQLPHPLYLNRPRTFTTTVSGLDFKQTAVHLGLAVRGGSGKAEYTLFAGPSLYQVDADLAAGVQPQEQYPYDTVTGTVTTTRSSKSAVGFHVGGRLDAWLGKSVGLGAQVRYGTAKVQLGPSGSSTEVTAGGFEVGGGLRFRF